RSDTSCPASPRSLKSDERVPWRPALLWRLIVIELKGAAALVTGGTSGIGLATAEALLKRGVNVVVNARRPKPDALEALDALAATSGVRCHFAEGDISQSATAADLVAATLETFGRLDIVVHAAGGPAGGTALQIEPDQWLSA